ncbi:flagellar hook-associated protein FlgK [Tranquillimonas rosea]|uniref:flagellar hook-associated protein FlgK n=1 Tax=Tranquillimonas rosea TaxID=641238 RepID=UPI003BA861C4
MSISGALSNALSGLTATARSAQVVSDNVANVTTDGFAAREIALGARSLGSGGVTVLGVTRRTDPALTAERLVADAALADTSTHASYAARLEKMLAGPDGESGLPALVSALDSSLALAASRPDSTARLDTVLSAAKGLAAEIRSASDGIQSLRQRADAAIASDLSALETGLGRIQDINGNLQRIRSAAGDPNALLDQRQAEIDRIAAIVPVRVLPRDNGAVALMTAGGQILLDGAPARIDFTPTPTVTAGQTLANGGVSGITVNGLPVTVNTGSGRLDGGRLSALFAQRDEILPAAQDRLDAVAGDLISRFADPATDPTLAGGPGLFTDAGALPAGPPSPGLAGRLTVSDTADPDAGGALWRLRSGLGAPTPGEVGDATGLQAMADALERNRPAPHPDLGIGHMTFGSLTDALAGRAAAARVGAEDAEAFQTIRSEALAGREAALGVDSDEEMQRLLLIEQAYAANARVVSTIDGMIQRLLEI